MDDLRSRLGQRLLLDGAMGTQLFAHGLVGDCPEIWNVEKPDVVEAIHRSYLAAGAQVLLTHTFGATEWKLTRTGHESEQETLCRAAAENALRAAEDKAYVLGDVGPTGELPEPFGPHPIDAFEEVFARQIEALVAGGVHGILVETMNHSAEAVAAIRAAKRACDLPVIGSMTYAPGKRGYRTMMGESVAHATKALLDAGADAVGANCGLGAAQMADVVREIRAVTDGPVWAKPNAGQARLVDGRTVFDEAADVWAARLSGVVAAGANLVGGCCGTTPEHIAAARRLLHEGEREP